MRALALLILLLPALASAEVKESLEEGFHVEAVALIGKGPARVYEALTEEIGAWWDPVHTYSGDAANLYLEARPQGCFCERLEGGGVSHLTVVHAEPGKTLRLTGGLGPLQSSAVAGVLTFSLAKRGESTRVVADYKVGGWDPGGLETWAGPVDGVIEAQLARLERYVETGSP